MTERDALEFRLVLAVAIVLIVALFAVRAVWSRSAAPESVRLSPVATPDAASVARAMTFMQPRPTSK